MKALTVLPFVIAASAATAETYTIDPTHAHIAFTVSHFGYANTIGFFGEIAGEIVFDEAAPEASSVQATVGAASVDTNHDHRDGWITGGDMLDVATYPEITFVSTGIEVTGENTGIITGELTMAGVTAPVALEVTFNLANPNPMTQTPTVGFSATGTLNRSDFGVDALLGPVGDEINVMIELEAVASGA